MSNRILRGWVGRGTCSLSSRSHLVSGSSPRFSVYLQLSSHGYVVGRKSFLQQAPVRSTLFSIRDYLDKSTNKQVAIKAYTKNDNTHKAKGYQKNDHQLKIIDKKTWLSRRVSDPRAKTNGRGCMLSMSSSHSPSMYFPGR